MSSKKYNSLILSICIHLAILAVIYFYAFRSNHKNNPFLNNQPQQTSASPSPQTTPTAPQKSQEELEKMLPTPPTPQQTSKPIVKNPPSPPPPPPPTPPKKPIVPVSKGNRVEKKTPETDLLSAEVVASPQKPIVPVTVGKRIEPPKSEQPSKPSPSSSASSINDHISAKDAEMDRWLEGRERVPSTSSQDSF